jgi:hypothetical protein
MLGSPDIAERRAADRFAVATISLCVDPMPTPISNGRQRDGRKASPKVRETPPMSVYNSTAGDPSPPNLIDPTSDR